MRGMLVFVVCARDSGHSLPDARSAPPMPAAGVSHSWQGCIWHIAPVAPAWYLRTCVRHVTCSLSGIALSNSAVFCATAPNRLTHTASGKCCWMR